MSNNMDRELGYSFTVDEYSVRSLDCRMLIGTHEHFMVLATKADFKNDFANSRVRVCKSEIERRLFDYDLRR